MNTISEINPKTINNTTAIKTMRTTIDKYSRLRDMELMNASKYDINARVSIIIQEVQ